MNCVFVFDSGSGGEFVAMELLRELPNEKFVLFKDVENCPYGQKSNRKLWHIVRKILTIVKRYICPKAIVVACNTASSLFEKKIKKMFATVPVFFVTPLINEKILLQKTLILATTKTVNCNKEILKARKDKNCIVVGFDDLAKKIDHARNSAQAKADLKLHLLNELSKYKTCGIKNIVLACTHYVYIKKQLREIFGNVKFFEKSKLTARELKTCLNGNFVEIGKQKKSISYLFKTQVAVVENLNELKKMGNFL